MKRVKFVLCIKDEGFEANITKGSLYEVIKYLNKNCIVVVANDGQANMIPSECFRKVL